MSYREEPPRATPRRMIAALAARLISEEGIHDFALAKRKAARQLGVTEGEAMPNNAEIEAEIRAYQALYPDDEHDERLAAMREVALELMQRLEIWRPALTGAVLDGTANGFSEVEIDVFADSAKDVEIFLLSEGVRYEHRDIRRPGPESPEAILLFEWEEVPVKLCVFDPIAERTPRRNGAERARLPAVMALCAPATGEPE